jgi:hypothetical protein
MIDREERYRRKRTKKATPIAREQYMKLARALNDIKMPYSAFFNYKDGPEDDLVICLSNDTFIVKDYFKENNND